MNKTGLAHTFLFLLFSFLAKNLSAQKHFRWTPELERAYHQTTSLRFAEAETALKNIAVNDPDNLLRLHVENYLDFFKIFINEEKKEFDILEKNRDKRLAEIEKHGDRSSPYYLYLLADIRLQWAIARSKFEEYATAFFEFNKAFKLLTENAEKFPAFMPNKKNLGVMHAFVGTIPDSYKWAVGWFSSMEGTIGQGLGELEETIKYAQQHDFIYKEEIQIFYAYLLLHVGNEKEGAWDIIHTANLAPAHNPMACFVMANVAMRTDKGSEAIAILEKRPQGNQYHPFPYLDYMLGLAKLQRLDADADKHLLKFIEGYKGRNFIKDAYQKLAWSQLVTGNTTGYLQYMERCKSEGYKVVGSDKSAYNEARKNEMPAVGLLKARLLFDGGYFEKALEILEGKKAADYFSGRNQLEFTYRMGRILHKLGRQDEALVFYEKTIQTGRHQPWYFACRSALEKGLIHEEAGQFQYAKTAYKTCLAISPDDHKAVLHQQAKAGLNRLKN